MLKVHTGQLRPKGTNPNNAFNFAAGEFCCEPITRDACEYSITIDIATPKTVLAIGYTRITEELNHQFGTAGITIANNAESVKAFQRAITEFLGGLMALPNIVLTHDAAAATIELTVVGTAVLRNLQYSTGVTQDFTAECVTPFFEMVANFGASMNFQGSLGAGLEMTAALEFTADGHEVEVNDSTTYAWSVERLSGNATATLTNPTANMASFGGFSSNVGDSAKWRVTCAIAFTYNGTQYQVRAVGIVIYSYDPSPGESVLEAACQGLLFTGSMDNYNIQSVLSYVADSPSGLPITFGLAGLNGDNSNVFPVTNANPGASMQPIYGVGNTLGRVTLKPNMPYSAVNLGEIWGNYLIFAQSR